MLEPTVGKEEVIFQPEELTVAVEDDMGGRFVVAVEEQSKAIANPSDSESVDRKLWERELRSLQRHELRFADSIAYQLNIISLLELSGRQAEALEGLENLLAKSESIEVEYLYAEALNRVDAVRAREVFASLASRNHLLSHLRLAEQELIDGNTEGARARVRDAYAIDPLDWRVNLLGGVLDIKRKDLQKAISGFRNCLRDKQNSGPAYYNLGVAYVLTGDSRKALTSLRAAIALSPLNKNATLLFADVAIEEKLGYEKAREQLVGFLNYFPDDLSIYEKLLAVYNAEGNIDDGIKFFLPFIESLDSVIVQNNYGVLLSKKHRKNASKRFQKAVAIGAKLAGASPDRNFGIAVLNLARSQIDLGHAKDASILLKSFLDSADLMWCLSDEVLSQLVGYYARSLALTNRDQEAATYLSELLERDELHLEGRIFVESLLASYHSIDTGNYTQALEHAKRCYELALRSERQTNDQINGFLNNYVYALIELGQLREAAELAKQLDSNSAAKAYILATKGLLAFRQGDEKRGHVLYQAAIGFCNSNELKMIFRAKLYYERALLASSVGERTVAKRLIGRVKLNAGARDTWQHNTLLARVENLKRSVQ